MVPGTPSIEDIKLCSRMGICLFSGNPQEQEKYTLKSKSKEIFVECGISVPPSSNQVSNEKELLITLTKLIANNLKVQKWLFKIDDEYGSRGIAILDIKQIKPIMDIIKRKVEITEDVILKIHDILSTTIQHKLQVIVPKVYKSFGEFIRHFCKKGGIIEASPAVPQNKIQSMAISFLIEPDSKISLIGSYDKFFSQQYRSCGYFFPQKSMPVLDLNSLIQTIGKKLYEKNVFGYCSVDLVSFPDPEHDQQLFWALGLKCYMDNAAATTLYFDFMMNGNLNQVTG